VSALCLSLPEERIEVQGEVWGRIVSEARGTNGFGYDPVFFYPPLNQTFAQLTIGKKSRISHRARALQKLRTRLGGI
jgi:XTP/dITP diphosphohydrolase